MDQTRFEKLITEFAREYYASPRSTRVPTPEGRVNVSALRDTGDARFLWVLEDFANFLLTCDRVG